MRLCCVEETAVLSNGRLTAHERGCPISSPVLARCGNTQMLAQQRPSLLNICGRKQLTHIRPKEEFAELPIEAKPRLTTSPSRSVVKNNPQRVPAARPYAAHSMPQVHPIGAPRTLHRTMMDCERNRVPLMKINNLRPGLHAWPLLGKNKFSSGEICTRLR
jgi:hypothetical protein